MKFGNLNKALNNFGKYVVQQSKSILTKNKKGGGDLYNSIRYTLDEEQKGFILDFYMEDYGIFQDQGVKGANPSKVSPNSKIKGQQAPNSPYKFGSGSKRGTFKQFVNKMTVFAQSKNLRFRDKKGQFSKGSYKSMGYVVAKNIYNRGLKPTYFFTKPFEAAFKRLPEELIKDFMLDIEKGIILGTKK
tara:strand:- start:987 stop:1550 length:564 start_codon:yes stop_codon:yes gene_type:complete